MSTHPDVHQDDDLHLRTAAAEAVSLRNQRARQEDALLLGGHVCAVADGVGGHADGDRAARAALTAFAAAVAGPVDSAGLVAAVTAAQHAVAALADGDFRNPGTTLVAVAAAPDRTAVHGIWVGDSRAYLVRSDGTVTRLTEDHTDLFGGLLHVLGDHGDRVASTPGTFSVPVGAGVSVLLCTDGVSGPAERALGHDEGVIAELLPGGLRPMVLALAAQGSDNATAVLVDVDALG